MSTKAHSLFDPAIMNPALGDSVRKLNPAVMIKTRSCCDPGGAAVTTAEIFVSSEPKAFTSRLRSGLVHRSLRDFAEAMAGGTPAKRRQMRCANRARNASSFATIVGTRSSLGPALRRHHPGCRREIIASDGESSKARPPSTNRPSRANRRPSFAKRAATGVRSRA